MGAEEANYMRAEDANYMGIEDALIVARMLSGRMNKEVFAGDSCSFVL